MQICPRLPPSILVLLACACSFDGTGLATVGQGASSTSGVETGALTEPPGSSTVEPTTQGPATEPTTEPTTGPTTGSPGMCGDGVPDMGEQCDNGQANGDDAACKANCTNNVCGDGAVGPGEGCDDGNDVDDDDCSNDCASKNCGNGVTDDGEACDDGNDVDTDACTSTCTLPVCGDGVQQRGEECDGPENGPDKPCTAGCKLNVCGDGNQLPSEACDDGNKTDGDGCSAMCVPEDCGDGVLQGGETCDDGNDINEDGCTNECKPAVCGDMVIQAGVEECEDNNDVNTDDCAECANAVCGDGFLKADSDEQCDDGNDNDSDGCTKECKFNVKRVFVTSKEYNGDLGGVNGANAKCAELAAAAVLGGTYLAWISADNQNSDPESRFTKAAIPYYKTNNEKVADNWDDLIDGSLDSKIDRYENGMPAAANANGDNEVWTNVADNGTQDGDDGYECMDWSGITNLQGSVGVWTADNGAWTDLDANAQHPCGETKRLYCFQQ